jgi:tetratricopeptide (TPR) repeat protein
MKSLTVIALAFLLLLFSASGQQLNLGKAQISIPKIQGTLQIDVGPTTWEAHVRSDGKEIQLKAMQRQDRLLITAFLQKVDFAASAEKCRTEWWPGTEKATPIQRDDLRQFEKNEIAAVEYVIPEIQASAIRQKNVHAYLGARDLCAEVHLSKVLWEPEQQKLFDDVLATVRLLPDESAAKDQSNDLATRYVTEASKLYMQHDYAKAAERYQKALDLEKKNRTLSDSFFRVLVDNLGLSYGISGKLNEAKEVFEYGITQDPEYPMFYYNLACDYGEMGKMNESLEQLRLAFKYQVNVIPGEALPDPLTDDSFRNFVKDKKFVDAVNEMKKQ